MPRQTKTKRLTTLVLALILATVTILGLVRVNEGMTVHYQAVGRVVDGSNRPVSGMQAVLLLEPPPPDGPQRDALFEDAAEKPGGLLPDGSFAGDVVPVTGLSDAKGAFLVRATGRLGPAHAIRLGLDRSGTPPFETAWLVLREAGRPDLTRTVSLLGWSPSPPDWGTFANRLPTVTLPPR